MCHVNREHFQQLQLASSGVSVVLGWEIYYKRISVETTVEVLAKGRIPSPQQLSFFQFRHTGLAFSGALLITISVQNILKEMSPSTSNPCLVHDRLIGTSRYQVGVIVMEYMQQSKKQLLSESNKL